MRFTVSAAIALITLGSAAFADKLGNVDSDGDMLLSSEEFLDTYGPDRGIETFRFIDKNKDGMVDSHEFWRAMMGQGPLKN